MVEVGTWKNFDDIEESLILDELLLLVESLGIKTKNHFRMIMAAQGVEVPDDPEDGMVEVKSSNDLPEELVAMERELHEKRAKRRAEREGTVQTFNGVEGLGYVASE